MGISAMNNAIKNNLDLLKNRKRKRFVHMPGNLGEMKKEKYDHVILDPKVLKEIRERVRKENKQILIKRIIVFLIILASLIGLLLL